MRTFIRTSVRTSVRTFALVLPLICCGCFPMQRPTSPWVRTRVVDAVTHRPIQGVAVVVWGDSDPDVLAHGETGADGQVSIPPAHRTIWLPPVPIDFFISGGVATFSAPGYQSLRLTWTVTSDPSVVELLPAPRESGS